MTMNELFTLFAAHNPPADGFADEDLDRLAGMLAEADAAQDAA